MKKNSIIILIFLLISNCTNKNDISDVDIKTALDFFIDSTITRNNKKEEMLIMSKFGNDLNTKRLYELQSDTIFSKKDIDFMIKQYNNLKNKKIENFLNNKHLSKINNNEPKIGQTTYLIFPPLFTLDKKYLLIYSKMFLWVNGEIKWDDLYFLYYINNKEYTLIGYLDWKTKK